MAEIQPFRGIRYNPEKISSLEDTVAPPYDVINEASRETLYGRHPQNVVRLILGKEMDGDDEGTNKYTRANEFLSHWMKDEILIRDEVPSIYLYNQEYEAEGAKKVRKGFVALIRLEAFENGVVLPHEATLAKPVADRLKLFRASQCNLSQVFGLYSDRESVLENLMDKAWEALPQPLSLQDDNGAGHEMKRLTDAETINGVRDFMKEKKIIIADGHHRYTTALAYKKEMEEKHGAIPEAPWNYVMMYFTNLYGDGISVGPIHRLIHGVSVEKNQLMENLKNEFEVKTVSGSGNGEIPEELSGKLKESFGKSVSFGLYFGNGEYCFLKQREGVNLEDKVNLNGPRDLKLLDVSIVHSLLLEGALKINQEDVKSQKNIIYKKDPKEAVSLVDKGEARLACLMNPTRVEQVESIAGQGYLMPQKSTFFYPKLLTGLVMSSIGRFDDN